MKILFVILLPVSFLLLPTYCIAQLTDTSKRISIVKMEGLGHHYYYKGENISLLKVQNIILDSKNMEAIRYINKVNMWNRNILGKIGFLAIPASIGGFILWHKSIFNVYKANGTTDTPKKVKYQDWAMACGLFAVACPTFVVSIKLRKIQCRNKAIRFYNKGL